MPEHPRFTINRSLVILLPQQPVLDWIMRVDPNPPQLTLAQLRQDQNAFLISERIETFEEAERWIYRRWKLFFESFLHEWYVDESWWPKDRSLKMFKHWFEIQYYPMVWDLADEAISHEDWE